MHMCNSNLLYTLPLDPHTAIVMFNFYVTSWSTPIATYVTSHEKPGLLSSILHYKYVSLEVKQYFHNFWGNHINMFCRTIKMYMIAVHHNIIILYTYVHIYKPSFLMLSHKYNL